MKNLKKTTYKTYEGFYQDIKQQTSNLNNPLTKSLKEETEVSQNMTTFHDQLSSLTKTMRETLPEYPNLLKIKI